jgi:hypothetical protein
MPPKPSPGINKPIYNSVTNPAPKRAPPVKSNAIQTTVSSGPIIIKTPNLPNTESVLKSQKIILPASTQSTIISSNILPNTETPKEEQDNTMTYVLIGAVIIGFIILQNKDI